MQIQEHLDRNSMIIKLAAALRRTTVMVSDVEDSNGELLEEQTMRAACITAAGVAASLAHLYGCYVDEVIIDSIIGFSGVGDACRECGFLDEGDLLEFGMIQGGR